jgi:polyphosphate kinase 2
VRQGAVDLDRSRGIGARAAIPDGHRLASRSVGAMAPSTPKQLSAKEYDKELEHLQVELLYMQEWIQRQGARMLVIFEGRDTAGKGGTIKRVTELLNPRFCRVVALPAPSAREKTQWYFQRYLAHLPAGGEIVLFDRSWYNRAGVERVMGFCTEDEYQQFMRDCPQIERSLIRSGIVLVKYWLSVSDEEQERRFLQRIANPHKRWKLSTIDLEARAHWVDYSEAKDEMFAYTDTKESPWWVVESDDKRSARLNLMSHLLTMVPYQRGTDDPITLPPRQKRAYQRPPKDEQRMVPTKYQVI